MLARGIESISCLLIVLMAFVFTSCATTNGDWEKAERLGTIKAYKTFLVEHPDADQADDARRRIEDILVDIKWERVQADNTIAAYEKFLAEFPQTKHTEEANNVLESRRYQQALGEDSIHSYATYLKHHPDSPRAKAAEKRLRELRYAYVKKVGTVEVYETFFSLYSEGPDVDEFRRGLPAARKLDKALALAGAIMKHAPKSSIQMSNFSMTGMNTERSDPTPQDLMNLEIMLKDGADPNAVSIAGFEAAGKQKLSNGMSIVTTGRRGKPVRAARGGMTLLEYCRVQKLDSIAKLLKKYGAK